MNRTRRTVTGLGLTVGGVLLGLLAVTALPWYRSSINGFLAFGTTVSDLRDTITFYKSAKDIYDVIGFGISPVYFSWLAVTLLVVGALLAAATIGLDGRASKLVGLVSAAVGLAGVVLTALAIQVIDIDAEKLRRATTVPSNPPGYLDYLGATSVGAWAMVLAFVAIGVGAILASGGRESMRDLLNGDPDPDEEIAATPDAPGEAEAPRRRGENW